MVLPATAKQASQHSNIEHSNIRSTVPPFQILTLLHTTAWNKQLSKPCCTVQEAIKGVKKAPAACRKPFIPFFSLKFTGSCKKSWKKVSCTVQEAFVSCRNLAARCSK